MTIDTADIRVAKGKFSDLWVAILYNEKKEPVLYEQGNSEEEARTKLIEGMTCQ